ncbi:MAG: serine/threonine-protein kinase [Gemmataceae bacterium]
MNDLTPTTGPPPSPTAGPDGGTTPSAGPGHGTVPIDAPPGAGPDAPQVRAPAGYVIDRELGRGGMGVVYAARQAELNRTVALKMILAGAHASAAELARFLRECQVMASLHHPNVAEVYDAGRHDGRPYFALEYVGGGTLADRVRGGPLAPREAARVMEQVARGVAYCHQKGVSHRDLKPANVLLTRDGLPKVADFGLAKRLDAGSGMTASGAVMGTPSYMPPELARGDARDAGTAADVYALGATLYHLLTGRPPFQGPTAADTLIQVLTDDPVPPRRLQPGVPRDLELITLKCLEKWPDRRYPTAEAVADDLARWQAGEPISARPPGLITRVWLWSQRIDRVRDAGAFTVFIAVALALWNLVAIASFTFDPTLTKYGEPAVRQLSASIFIVSVPLGMIGYWCTRMRMWAFWVGMLLICCYLGFIIGCLTGVGRLRELINLGGFYTDNPAAREPVFSLIAVITAMGLPTYVAGAIALYANRGRPLPPSTWLSR